MNNTDKIRSSLQRRYSREKRFRLYGKFAVLVGFAFLILLLGDITHKSLPAFQQTAITLPIKFDAERLGISGELNETNFRTANYRGILKQALSREFPSVSNRRDKRDLGKLMSVGAEYQIRDYLMAHPQMINQSVSMELLAHDDVDTYIKSDKEFGRISDKQAIWIQALEEKGLIELHFNGGLFTYGDSREPELAGIRGAMVGSALTLLVTLVLSFPVGVLAAVFLEEFAPKNCWVDIIEININNLAAVPSIVFGILGLAVLINFFGMPRSVPLVGGIVLALMTLPTIIITSRSAIKAVPPSIREAALGLGASRMQTVFQHVLPLAMPGVLTGSIIGMARALGETAPLLMIGMVAFIVDVPESITDPASVLPVQIYLWADSPERGFVAKTSAAIIVLIGFLIVMNALAIWLRKRFERRW